MHNMTLVFLSKFLYVRSSIRTVFVLTKTTGILQDIAVSVFNSFPAHVRNIEDNRQTFSIIILFYLIVILIL